MRKRRVTGQYSIYQGGLNPLTLGSRNSKSNVEQLSRESESLVLYEVSDRACPGRNKQTHEYGHQNIHNPSKR